MATFTISVDKKLKEKMDAMPEINWAEYLKKRLYERALEFEAMKKKRVK